MKHRLKVAHTSDVHLDGTSSRGTQGGYRNGAEYAFAKVVDFVKQDAFDLFIIAGDLYDYNRINQTDIDFVRQQLQRIQCPVIMIPGNHDVHDTTSHWHKFDPLELGDHVFPIKEHEGKSIDFDDLAVRIWARRWPNTHQKMNH